MDLTKDIKVGSSLHTKILDATRIRIKASINSAARKAFISRWKEAEDKVAGYLPERAADAIRRASRAGGKPEFTTIEIPYSQAVLLASHTYWVTVFLNRNPVLQVQGVQGEGEMQTQAIEAYLNYQTQVGSHLPVYHTWFYDAGKYGQGIVGLYWEEEYTNIASIEKAPALSFGGIPLGKSKKIKVTRRVKGYQGNRIFNIRPMDFFHDPRVTLADFQKGEFCGNWTRISWNSLVKGFHNGAYINVNEAKNGALSSASNGTHSDSGLSLYLPEHSMEDSYTSGALAAKSLDCYEIYIDLIPKDWGLGTSSESEKWVFVVTADFKVVLAAKPLGTFHGKYPFAVLQISPEGYSVYDPGIPDDTRDIQNTIDWLINSHFYNVRKTLNNEFLVDPTQLEIKDLLNPMPGGLIRIKPGGDVNRALRQLNVSDVTRGHIGDLDMMLGLGQRITGVNDQVMGVQAPSSRRSATEIRSSNTFSVNRLKTISEYFSAIGFAPLSKMMIQNSQQYYDAEMKLKLAGNAAQLAGTNFIQVTPEAIAGFYEYVPVDGSLPVDRFAQANLWRMLLAEAQKMPQVLQQYDIAKLFGYIGSLTGLKNIDQFKLHVIPDAQAQAQAQQGNIIPLQSTSSPAATPAVGNIGVTQ